MCISRKRIRDPFKIIVLALPPKHPKTDEIAKNHHVKMTNYQKRRVVNIEKPTH